MEDVQLGDEFIHNGKYSAHFPGCVREGDIIIISSLDRYQWASIYCKRWDDERKGHCGYLNKESIESDYGHWNISIKSLLECVDPVGVEGELSDWL